LRLKSRGRVAELRIQKDKPSLNDYSQEVIGLVWEQDTWDKVIISHGTGKRVKGT
jgi:hypothetical protein